MQALIFIYANILDILTSVAAFTSGAQELNPVYGTNPSILRLFIVKAVGITIILWCVGKMRKQHRYLLLIGGATVFILASINNLLIGVGVV